MAAYIAIILSSISIILLITVIIKFKKLFSTESIIERTKEQMNKIISDINNNANMDINLINDATKRTRKLLAEAEEKMEEFKEASNRLRDMIAEANKESLPRVDVNHLYNKKRQENIETKSTVTQIPVIGNAKSLKIKSYKTKQQSLFDIDSSQDLFQQKENKESDENLIPNIVTNLIPTEKNMAKKNINEKVEKLFSSGMQVEDIAVELSCSISEVQFIIDMLNE